jgi:hypothetical protein
MRLLERQERLLERQERLLERQELLKRQEIASWHWNSG